MIQPKKPEAQNRPRSGDIVLFNGGGAVFNVLSRALKIFEPWWDRKQWHMAVIVWPVAGGYTLFEAMGTGVTLNFYTSESLKGKARIYRWLEEEPEEDKIKRFIKDRLHTRYDVAVYFLTMLQYLLRRIIHIKLPLVLDDRYSCWELVDEFCDEFGYPFAPRYGFPMITDFLKQNPAEIRF